MSFAPQQPQFLTTMGRQGAPAGYCAQAPPGAYDNPGARGRGVSPATFNRGISQEHFRPSQGAPMGINPAAQRRERSSSRDPVRNLQPHGAQGRALATPPPHGHNLGSFHSSVPFISDLTAVGQLPPARDSMVVNGSSQMGAQVDTPTFAIGQQVSILRSNGAWAPGTVTKCNDETVTVMCDDGAQKGVPSHMLSSHLRRVEAEPTSPETFGGSELYGSELMNGSELANGSELWNGSELMNGSEVAGHATQLAGVLCSISGGSLFLKHEFAADKAVKNRSSLIPRHNTSSFVSRNYEVVKELGKGSFSRVQLLRDRRSCAARVLKISEGGMGTKQSQMLKNEIHLLSALDHPNIVKIYEYSEDISRGQLLMVLEYVGGGDCQQLLRSTAKSQTEAFIGKLIWQLLSVLNYCHSRGILHCDVKPENMMLTQPRGKGELPDCKVIDFGLTHRIDQPTRDFVGTPSYMAPEIVKGTVAYTVKADIWSVGITTCELLAAKAPFGRPSDYKGKIEPVLQNIRDFSRFRQIEQRLAKSESWVSRSASSKDFVRSIIISDPAKRPHADEALEHNWMVSNKETPRMLS